MSGVMWMRGDQLKVLVESRSAQCCTLSDSVPKWRLTTLLLPYKHFYVCVCFMPSRRTPEYLQFGLGLESSCCLCEDTVAGSWWNTDIWFPLVFCFTLFRDTQVRFLPEMTDSILCGSIPLKTKTFCVRLLARDIIFQVTPHYICVFERNLFIWTRRKNTENCVVLLLGHWGMQFFLFLLENQRHASETNKL